jgi:hypothetical protein
MQISENGNLARRYERREPPSTKRREMSRGRANVPCHQSSSDTTSCAIAAGDNEIEAIAISIFAELGYTFNGKSGELSRHEISPSKPSAELSVENHGRRVDQGEHRTTLKYSAPAQRAEIVVYSERCQTMENIRLAEGCPPRMS